MFIFATIISIYIYIARLVFAILLLIAGIDSIKQTLNSCKGYSVIFIINGIVLIIMTVLSTFFILCAHFNHEKNENIEIEYNDIN